MVRRGSTVRVRQRAFESAWKLEFFSPLHGVAAGRDLASAPHPPLAMCLGGGPVAIASNQLSEREGERRHASGEHDERECRYTSRN
jgi:hypothetical protein